MPRLNKNLMYFIYADKKNLQKAIDLKREIMALEIIKGKEILYDNLSEKQKEKLQNKLEISPLNLKINVANAYCYLAYPVTMEKLETIKLDLFETLIHKTTYTINKEEKTKNQEIEKINKERTNTFKSADRQNTIIKKLEEYNKAITPNSKEIAPDLLKKWLFSTSKKIFDTKAIIDFFAQEPTLQLLLEKSKLRDSIIKGIEKGTFHANKDEKYYHKNFPLKKDYFDWEGKLIIALSESMPLPKEEEPQKTESAQTFYPAFEPVVQPKTKEESKTIPKPEFKPKKITVKTHKTSPENAFSQLEQRLTTENAIKEIEFKFEGYKDVDTVISFLPIFPRSTDRTYADFSIFTQEGENTSFRLEVEDFAIEKLERINLKGMLEMLKAPDLAPELVLKIKFDKPVQMTELSKIKNAMISKKIAEVVIESLLTPLEEIK